MSKTRKSERRQRAAESLVEHFDDHHQHHSHQSPEVDYGYEDEDVAESWSSHDISAGAVKPSKRTESRRASTGAGSKSSTSSRRRDSSSRSNHANSSKDPRSKSPSGNSTKSDRSHNRHSPPGSGSRSSVTADGVKSPYKGLSKLAVVEDAGSISSTPRRSRKAPHHHSSGIPRSPAAAGLVSPRGHSKTSSGSVASSSSGRRKSSAPTSPPPSDKLQRILELGNQWKNMKQQHEMAAQQATSRRVDLTKEIF